jgi:hypothetical protein
MRDTLEKQRPAFTAVAVAVVIVGIGLVVWQSRSGIPGPTTKAYYTDDDGKSWFTDELGKLCPFDHNGRPAYLANVFKCGAGGPFVAFLSRVSDAARPQLEQLKTQAGGTQSADYLRVLNGATEVRRPGDKAWVRSGTAAYDKVLDFPCPDGGADPHSVSP